MEEVPERNLQPWFDVVQDFRTKQNKDRGRREWWAILLLVSRDSSENALTDKFSSLWNCKSASMALDVA